MEAASRAADPRVTGTARARYGDSHVTHTIATSGGCEVSFDATQCTLSMAAIARHNGLANQGYAMEMGRALADLDVEAAGRRAAWRACASLGGEPVPTKRASVVMAPEVVSELLNGVLQALSGDAVRKGRSFLAGAVGETIAASRVTLTDDGRLHGALGTTPVDGEGMQTQHTPLIERGTLVGLLHASDSAIRAGVASTGNAGRSSFRATPDVMASNVLLEAGSRSTEELIRSLDDGFYVVTSRNVGGINPVSGDYSVGAAGVWVERGEMVMPVTGVTIAAPIRELLGNVIEASNDPRWVGYTAAMLAPSLRVDGMMIGGR
jgi:PmbA protein